MTRKALLQPAFAERSRLVVDARPTRRRAPAKCQREYHGVPRPIAEPFDRTRQECAPNLFASEVQTWPRRSRAKVLRLYAFRRASSPRFGGAIPFRRVLNLGRGVNGVKGEQNKQIGDAVPVEIMEAEVGAFFADEAGTQPLYVDLPNGQVSFHSEARGEGPDYAGEWDGVKNVSTGRICTFVARVFAGVPA